MARETPINNFSTLVAYLVPGAAVLLGLSQFSETLRSWFATASHEAPSIGGFLYLTVASLAAGMTVSAVRWAVVDRLHGWTGLRQPPLDFARLGQNVEAFGLLIEIHYTHYLFYSNMAIATVVAYTCYRIKLGIVRDWGWLDLVFIVLEAIFFSTSRDTLKEYYSRSQQLLPVRRP